MRRFWTSLAVVAVVGVIALGTIAFAAGSRSPRAYTDADADGSCDHATACHPGGDACAGASGCAARLSCAGHAKPGAGCGYCYDDLLGRVDELKLTERQVAALKKLAGDSARKRADMVSERREAQEQWTALLDKEDADLAEVRKQIERTAKAWADLRYACVRNMIEVRRILTSEQWSQWRKKMGNRPIFRIDADSAQAAEPVNRRETVPAPMHGRGMCGRSGACH